MKIRAFIENAGANHARLEIEDDCEVGGLRQWLEKINSGLSVNHASKAPTCVVKPVTVATQNGDTEMASEEARTALWAAAKSNGTDVESVCKEYGVDPNHISKRDCWRMTQNLNAKTGYGKDQQQQRPEPPKKQPGYKIRGGDDSSFWKP